MVAKKSPSPEKHFSFPRFDRQAFLAKEVRDAKVSFISLGLAALMALTSLIVARFILVGPAILVGFMGPAALYFLLPKVGIDTGEFERKNWASPALITFFAWLGLFILFSNPPFQDLSAPKIQDFRIYELQDTEFKRVPWDENGLSINDNSTLLIVVRSTDNWEVKEVRLELYQGDTLQHPWLLQRYDSKAMGPQYNVSYNDRYEGHYYFIEVPPDTLATGLHHFKFYSLDTKGNERTNTYEVQVY